MILVEVLKVVGTVLVVALLIEACSGSVSDIIAAWRAGRSGLRGEEEE